MTDRFICKLLGKPEPFEVGGHQIQTDDAQDHLRGP